MVEISLKTAFKSRPLPSSQQKRLREVQLSDGTFYFFFVFPLFLFSFYDFFTTTIIITTIITTTPTIISIIFTTTTITTGVHYKYSKENSVQTCSCLMMYLQVGVVERRMNMVLELLCQILAEPCYDVLRTQEQLGWECVVDGVVCFFSQLLIFDFMFPKF